MAKVRGVRKLLRSDFKEAPDWIDKLLSPLNELMDSVIGALRGKLTFRENFYCEVKTFEFTHGTELKISYNLQSYAGILIMSTPEEESADYAITAFKARVLSPNLLGVTIYFSGAGTTKGNVKINILG